MKVGKYCEKKGKLIILNLIMAVCIVLFSNSEKVFADSDDMRIRVYSEGESQRQTTSARKIKVAHKVKNKISISEEIDSYYFYTNNSSSIYSLKIYNVDSTGIFYSIYSDADCTHLVEENSIGIEKGSSVLIKLSHLKKSHKYYVKIYGSVGKYNIMLNKNTPVVIKWQRINNVTGYEVYRSVSQNGHYKRIKKISKSKA